MEKKPSFKKRFSESKFKTPFGHFSGKDVFNFLKTFSSIIKAIVSRTLYAIYTLVAVWRVAEALNDPTYWLLLFTIGLLVIELLHTVIARKGGELKWITPSVFFYLVCAVPPIWLLELKLLEDRLQGVESNSTNNALTGININLSNEGWTLALEQILIFVLVFGKWIAPKGQLSRDELSQLLLVYLGAGADIIELLEVFAEDEVKNNADIVYFIMSVWSWSLLQFCIVPTAVKNLPTVYDEPESAITSGPLDDSKSTLQTTVENTNETNNVTSGSMVTTKTRRKAPFKRSASEGNPQSKKVGNKWNLNRATSSASNLTKTKITNINSNSENMMKSAKQSVSNGGTTLDKVEEKEKEKCVKSDLNDPHSLNKVQSEDYKKDSDDVNLIDFNSDKESDPIYALTSGKRVCVCFCCYTEIWGMVLSMMFQDVPFLITRLFIMLYYKVVSHMTVFFTCKNVLIIILLLNRIRVIVLEERQEWKEHMTAVKQQRINNSKYLQTIEKLKNPSSNMKTNAFLKRKTKSSSKEEDGKNLHPRKRLRSNKWVFWRS